MKTIAAFALGLFLGASSLVAAAPTFKTDGLVLYLQNMFHVSRGGMIPADYRFPAMPRLQYLGTAINGDLYNVYLKKIPQQP